MILRITESTGRTVTGYVQGVGGLASLNAVERACRRASARQPTLIFEPETGKCQVFTDLTAGSNGPFVLVNLWRAKVESGQRHAVVHVGYDGSNPHLMTVCGCAVGDGEEMRRHGDTIVPRRMAERVTCADCAKVLKIKIAEVKCA